MRTEDNKRLLNWFKLVRAYGEGWRKRHEVPYGQTEFGLFKPRMIDKTIRDLVRMDLLESRPAERGMKEWRYKVQPAKSPEDQEKESDILLQRALM